MVYFYYMNTAYPVQEFFTIIFYKVRKIPSPKFLFRYRSAKTSDDADTLWRNRSLPLPRYARSGTLAPFRHNGFGNNSGSACRSLRSRLRITRNTRNALSAQPRADPSDTSLIPKPLYEIHVFLLGFAQLLKKNLIFVFNLINEG